MSAGAVSWKRAILWPRYEVGLRKGTIRNLSFVFVLIVLFVSAMSVVNGDGWSSVVWCPLAYGAFGLVWWLAFQFDRHWPTFATDHPTTARALRAASLVFAWEVRVLAGGKAAPKALRYWFWTLVGLGCAGYLLAHFDGVDRRVGYAIMATAELLTECTGAYLGYREWRKPQE